MESFSQNDQDAINTIIAQASALPVEQRQAMLPKVIRNMEDLVKRGTECAFHNKQKVSHEATAYAANQLKSLL